MGALEKRGSGAATPRAAVFVATWRSRVSRSSRRRIRCELLRDGEEYTTQACNYCGRCYLVGGSKVFFCGLCCKPPFVADRDDKGASRTLAVKCLALQ